MGAWIETAQRRYALLVASTCVAPRVGAWIETLSDSSVRTLLQQLVAPRVGAWIETCQFHVNHRPADVAPRVGAWIVTQKRMFYWFAASKSPLAWGRGSKLALRRRAPAERDRSCRPSRGGVDRNTITGVSQRELILIGRPSRGGVDRNFLVTRSARIYALVPVAPRVGAWIETLTKSS